MTDNLKQDINFLEYPLWSINEKTENHIIKWKDEEGYLFECSRSIPSKVDILILYYLMLNCQTNGWKDTLILSKYNILNGCGMLPSKPKYIRLKESLEKWKRVTISFKGKFYDNKEYLDMEFGIINDWNIRESDKKVRIELNTKWIEKIKNSHFFKYISFTQMKALRSPLALRLYEILIKNFYNRDIWEINILNLAEKIPMSEKYAAHIIPKIKPAVKRINEKTDLKISLQVIKKGRNEGKFIFTKKEIIKPVQKELFKSDIPAEIVDLIPNKFVETSAIICGEIINKSDIETLKKCILYANTHKDIKNYGALLRKIYKDNLYKNAVETKEIPTLFPGMKLQSKSGKEFIVQEGNVIASSKNTLLPSGEIISMIMAGKFKIVIS